MIPIIERKKAALIEMIRDFARDNDYILNYEDRSGQKEYTSFLFWVHDKPQPHRIDIVWEECENIYSAMVTIENELMRNGYFGKKTTIGDVIGSYVKMDVETTKAAIKEYHHMFRKPNIRSVSSIEKVIFNDPATIVFWADKTKTVVKAENEEFDPEMGLAMAITKKALGNNGRYFNEIKKWVEPYAQH